MLVRLQAGLNPILLGVATTPYLTDAALPTIAMPSVKFDGPTLDRPHLEVSRSDLETTPKGNSMNIIMWIVVVGAVIATVRYGRETYSSWKCATKHNISDMERAAFYFVEHLSPSNGISGPTDPRIDPLYRTWTKQSAHESGRYLIIAIAVAICGGTLLALGIV